MEYLEGTTLAARLSRGPLPYDEVIGCGIEVAEALAEAHRLGLIHRDLKPSNIMLTAQGAKLLDFGLAKAWADAPEGPLRDEPTATALTERGSMLGTLRYMAPEQVEGLSVDPRTDIFAFGAVVYEIIAGQPAFLGPTKARITVAILESFRYRSIAPSGDSSGIDENRQDLPLEAPRRTMAERGRFGLSPESHRRQVRDGQRASESPRAENSRLSQPGGTSTRKHGRRHKQRARSKHDGRARHPLSRVGRLKVVAGAPCMRVDGARRNPIEVARELGVDAVIRGAVSQSADRLRVNEELLYPAGNLVLWSDTSPATSSRPA